MIESEVVPEKPLDQVLWECFRYFVALDESHAAIHVAPTRYSPITFRVAEHLAPINREWLAPWNAEMLDNVLRHRGSYAEDGGR